jgi:hypothetical protein
MTSPGQYGSHQYQSPETRALASITAESYDKDQAKTLIKLKNDVGYMAAYMRKMQKQIDQANENFIQQIQSFIADFIVLLGGGSLTTIDFGDLRYVIQAIGALLGFQSVGGIPIPINLFTAAWNFFGIYIAPTQQFADVINELIDAAISIIIDALGEIPVLGQSIQQLAAWLIEIRDALWPLVDTVFLLIDTLSGQPGTEADDVMGGLFQQIIDMLLAAPDVLMDVLDALINLLLETPQILLSLLNGLIQLLIDSPDILNTLLQALVDLILQLPAVLEQLLTGLIQLLIQVPNLLFDLLDALITLLTASPEVLERLVIGVIDLLVNLPESLLQLTTSLIGLVIATPEILLELTEAVAENLGELIGIDFSGFEEFINSIAAGFSDLLGFDPANALSADSPLNALNLFNQVPPNLMGLIPVSQIGDIATNLLENPNFATPQSIVNNPGWIWNGTDIHTTGGSAQTTADGQSHSIISNTIPVAQNQELVVGIWTKFQSLAAAANQDAIRLSVEGYLGNVLQSTTMVDSIPSPSGNSVNAGHNNFVQLTGNYPVPAGIDNIVVVPEVTAAATAGTVLFGDAQATKSGLMPQNLVANLPLDMQARIQELQSLQNAVAGKAGALITDVQNRLKNLKFDGTGQFDASKLFNIAPINSIPTNLLTVANVPDLGSITDQLTNSLIGAGNQFLGTTPPQARLSMDRLFLDVLNLNQKMQDIRSSETATNISGMTATVNFSQYPDGALPSMFTTTYSGAGTSSIGVIDGQAGWRVKNNDGNRNAIIVYNLAPTKTDFQSVRGTLAGPPPGGGSGGIPRIAAIGRVDNPANPRNYVWARGYCTGFLTYRGDIGCTVNGVDTVWASDIPLTWSMDIIVIIGAQGNPRRYQVFSGTTLVYDYTEVGTVSRLGDAYRYWGCRTEIRTGSNGAVASPAIAGTSVSDNQPPAVVGSTFRARRASGSDVTFSGTNKVPNGYFDTLDYCSDDMTWDGNNLKVSQEGTYVVNLRYLTPNIPGGAKADIGLYVNNAGVRRMGGGFADSSFGANSGSGIDGTTLIYLRKNDLLTPGYIVDANVTSHGSPTDNATWFEVCLVNRTQQ